jgi:phosphoribulokinase
MSHRPIILGIVGDSAAGKTTLTKGIAQFLAEENVTFTGTDDYHRYNRHQCAELGITMSAVNR